MTSITNARAPRQHAFAREERKGWFTRLRERMTVALEPAMTEDWPEPVKPPRDLTAEQTPTTGVGPQQPAHRPHPQFAMQPAPTTHVLDRMQHLLVDLRRDPGMTAMTAAKALHNLNVELSGLAQQEFDQQRRMERNQADAQAQAALLADAVRRGKAEQGVEQAVDGIAGRAAHVADPQPTLVGGMPPITDGMPDPRIVTVPADVSEGDVESSQSPVREGGVTAVPSPSVPFLGGEVMVPAPRREPLPARPVPVPAEGLAHEVHAPGPVTVLPVQGVEKTSVLPVIKSAAAGGGDDD